MDANENLALRITRLVKEKCDSVPHDIGIQVCNIIDEERPVEKWTSTKDKMPPANSWAFVCYSIEDNPAYQAMDSAYYDGVRWAIGNKHKPYSVGGNVTHWMKLPAHPNANSTECENDDISVQLLLMTFRAKVKAALAEESAKGKFSAADMIEFARFTNPSEANEKALKRWMKQKGS